MGEKRRGRKKTSGIPYPSKDRRYWIVAARMKKGETLEEALVDVEIRRPYGFSLKETHKTPPMEKSASPSPPPAPIVDAPIEQHTPVPDPGPGQETLILKEMGKQTIFLGRIARALDQIADRLAPQPGLEGTVTLTPPSHDVPAPYPSSLRCATGSAVEGRVSENGLKVGDKVLMKVNVEAGHITRVLPNKKDIEVRFRNCTRTVRVDQVDPVRAKV